MIGINWVLAIISTHTFNINIFASTYSNTSPIVKFAEGIYGYQLGINYIDAMSCTGSTNCSDFSIIRISNNYTF